MCSPKPFPAIIAALPGASKGVGHNLVSVVVLAVSG